MLVFRSSLLIASIPLFSFASAYIVTTEKWEPDALLVPGKTLFYNVVVEAKDTVVLVDVILANGILGNTSDVFADSDLRKKDDASAGFTVPFVPPGKQYTVRLVETSTKRFLADSPQFEIFGLNGAASSGASSLPATTLPALSTITNSVPSVASNSSPGASSASQSGSSSLPATSLPSVSKTTTNAVPSASITTVDTGSPSNMSGAAPIGNESKSKTPVGAIVGGIVGGLAVVGLVIFFLLWRGRQRSISNATPQGMDNEKAYGLASPGPHAVEPYTLPPSSLSQGAGLVSTTSLTGTDARSTSVGPLPSKLGYGITGTSSSLHAGSSSLGGSLPDSGPSTNLTRVGQLRLERERINRELAALEQRRRPDSNTTGSSSAYGASSYLPPSTLDSRSNQESLAEQLAMLQAQIRQLEERQQHRESDLPPMYDGPAEPATSALSPHVSTTLSPYPGGSKR